MSPQHYALPLVYPLHYVCAFCGDSIVQYPNVKTHEPATLSVCDKADCKAQASARYKAMR